MSLNENLRKIIKERGIKVTEIAKKTGISRQNLERILDADDIKLSQAIAICNVLEISLCEFINDLHVNKSLIEQAKTIKTIHHELEIKNKELKLLANTLKSIFLFLEPAFLELSKQYPENDQVIQAIGLISSLKEMHDKE